MKTLKKLSKALPVAAVLMMACASTTGTGAATASQGSVAFNGARSWSDSVLATLTLREKAAQLVWAFSLGDYVPDDSPAWRQVTSWIRDQGVGGFIVSVGSPLDIAAKINRMQALSKIPLIIGADYETGAGMRARAGYFLPNAIDLGGATVFPPEMAMGATGDTSLAYAQGRATAIEARAIGVQIDFTPVLDVNNNPGNPVINTRSYGEDPQQVARFGAAMVRGLQDNGMIATGKHFPGHGDTETNSHLALPVVNVSRERLESVELVPFKAAIASGLGAIMSFHGVMPAFDSAGVPATLSRNVMTGVLRGELGFNGLIISDAMDMKGGLIQFGLTESVQRAIAAGLDIILQPSDVGQAINAIVAGVTSGRFTEQRVNESVLRVLRAKERMGLNLNRTADLTRIPAVVGDSSKAALARTIAEKSITLVRDSAAMVPLRPDTTLKILSITVASKTDLGAGSMFNAQLRARYPALRAEYITTQDAGVNYARMKAAADSADVTIISSYVGQVWDATTIGVSSAFTSLVNSLVDRGHAPVMVSFGNPYLLQQLPRVGTYVAAWGGSPASQAAAARALTGDAAISGHLPISIPPFVARGAGMQRPARAR
ncbi:MAG: glycoside hydrolase family 3 C-terminal domain-containing protein [Gemmatimonadaceae bacterium]|nr:glycoside hydrolase family 3 C-terminal domain-containing protein [Gemmatimonadaceae bacterium]